MPITRYRRSNGSRLLRASKNLVSGTGFSGWPMDLPSCGPSSRRPTPLWPAIPGSFTPCEPTQPSSMHWCYKSYLCIASPKLQRDYGLSPSQSVLRHATRVRLTRTLGSSESSGENPCLSIKRATQVKTGNRRNTIVFLHRRPGLNCACWVFSSYFPHWC